MPHPWPPQPPLAGLLALLAPQRRLAFAATQVLGLSYAEAAQVCGCPVETVRARVAGSRDQLVAALRGWRTPPYDRTARR